MKLPPIPQFCPQCSCGKCAVEKAHRRERARAAWDALSDESKQQLRDATRALRKRFPPTSTPIAR